MTRAVRDESPPKNDSAFFIIKACGAGNQESLGATDTLITFQVFDLKLHLQRILAEIRKKSRRNYGGAIS